MFGMENISGESFYIFVAKSFTLFYKNLSIMFSLYGLGETVFILHDHLSNLVSF